MIETELKILLDAAGETRLTRHPGLQALRRAPRRTQKLVSIYFDTEDQALAAAGISLRLRRIGRRWVQTIKRRQPNTTGNGLFANVEVERPAPGGRLALTGEDPVYAAIAEAVGKGVLAPLFETQVRRIVEHLAAPGGGEVELAIDRGEIVAGERHAPILEAELELVAGDVGAVYALARELFPEGPVRFARANKAARGYALARTGTSEESPSPRKAGTFAYDAEASVETVARDVLRDCFAQIATNMVVVADSEAVEGPHQLRVGLRRLRTALKVFAASLGGEAAEPLGEEAKRLGRVVSGLRDLDVLIAEVATVGLDTAARDALMATLRDRRKVKRAEVRAALTAPDSVSFLFDLGRFIEARGWLAPADFTQSARLAAPISEVAPVILAKRRRKAKKRGRGIEDLDYEGLHALRKELKKLRYVADMLDPIYPGRKVTAYLRSLKDLQDSFGSLTDAAMSEGWLTGPEAPGRTDPEAQRAVGWVLGTLAAKVAADRPKLFERWRDLAEARPFWT